MNTEKNMKDPYETTKKLMLVASEEKLKGMDEAYLINLSLCFKNELNKTFREIERLKYENEKLLKKMEDLENAQKPTHTYAGYPKHKDFIAKLLFILSKNKAEMTFDDIVKAFFLLENDLDEKWRSPNKSISKIISRACNFNMVIRKKVYGNNGYYVYGLLKD